MARILRRVVALGAVGFALLQLVPYEAWRFDNPPVVRAADFPTAQAEAVARAACFDCHGHETGVRGDARARLTPFPGARRGQSRRKPIRMRTW